MPRLFLGILLRTGLSVALIRLVVPQIPRAAAHQLHLRVCEAQSLGRLEMPPHQYCVSRTVRLCG